MSSRFIKEYHSPYLDEPQTSNNSQQFIYIDYELQNTDTLLSLSIKFGVSIGDLKRINVIQNDRELSALKLIRIPIKPNSIHTETFAGKLKYAGQPVTRLNTSLPLNIEFNEHNSDNSSSANLNSDEEKSQGEETHLIGRDSNDHLIAQTDFMEMNDASAPLLESIEQTKVHKSARSKQLKEAKKLLKQFDNKLDMLKNQNEELLKQTELLVPIQTCSFLVETRYQNNNNNFLNRNKKGLVNLNLRDVLMFACLIVVIVPLFFLFYRYVYIKEHAELQSKP